MPVWKTFGGIAPRVSPLNLRDDGALMAHDVKLRNGRLEPWRERLLLGDSVPDALTFKYVDCCALTWDKCVSVATLSPDYGRHFISGRQDYAETMTLDQCQPTYRRLGIPAPDTSPSTSGQEVFGPESAARIYAYTYVNNFGGEGPPSYPGQTLTVKDGSAVQVSGFAYPPAEYGITGIRIYRSSTGYRTGAEQEQENVSVFALVDEIAVTDYYKTYIDVIPDVNLGPSLATRENREAPLHLRHIARLEGTGILTGVTQNRVHFSRSMQPWNWPADLDVTLHGNIVNMRTMNRYVFVSTDNYPYVLDGADNCKVRQCRPTEGTDYPLPDLSCGYAHSSTVCPFGMVYSSKDGLVLLKPNAQFDIITKNWFDTNDWLRLRPDTARLAYWRGYLVCVTDVISFLLEIDGNTYADYNLGALATISDKPVDMDLTTNGELIMLENDQRFQWDSGVSFRRYQWISKEFGFAGRESPNSAKVRGSNVRFAMLSPIRGVLFEKLVSDETPFRIGRLGRNLNYRVGIDGTGIVDWMSVGSSFSTLQEGK